MKRKILVGIPPKNHVILAMDEVKGLQEIGYTCQTIVYTRNNQSVSKFNKLLGVLSNAFAIVKRLRKFKPDILYLNSRFEPVGTTRDFITILIIKLMYWRNLRIAIKTHGSHLSIITNKSFFFDSIVIPYLTNKVALWFFLSNEELKLIKKHAPQFSTKTRLTANIIDPKRSIKSDEFLPSYGLSNEKFTFFFAGRMIAEKGIFSIIRSINKFKYKDQCLFIMAGNGEQFEELKTEIQELNLGKYVYLPGFVPEEECDHFFGNTNALIFPTYFDEGFPMALFKAVASGLPIITTKTRAAIDHLKEPENCLWVDGRSPESVAEALKTLYENTQMQQKMSTNNSELGRLFSRKQVALQMHKDFKALFTS